MTYQPKIKKHKINFQKLQSVTNPNSIHGIYPYRGKISAVDTANVIQQFSKNKILLDPFCGTGTIVFEGYRHGLNVIGVDRNPLAIIVTKGKLSLENTTESSILKETGTIVEKSKKIKKYKPMPSEAKKAFHKDTAIQIMQMKECYDEMSDYLKSIFCGAICLTARGCNNYMWTSTTVGKDIQPKRFINFYEKFSAKAKKHFVNFSNSKKSSVFLDDSRNLTSIIPKKSIDYVFTSPPYFNALDYTAYYAKFVMPILGIDRLEVKKDLIQFIKTYEEDMKKVLSEINAVTKDNGLIIFVVGDKKIKNELINGGKFFSKLFDKKPNSITERSYSNSASQIFDKLNKTARKEQIVMWDKSTW